ncbi:hypothetical protein TIFTF001_009545 [Ficus carica]|uniref:Uncharacterized protein n=1 Tax=Ficus carica TaxID=3494 RepID=A0AA88AAL1_FICCA|nr:hypothetical protein TIFTF001_009545 [Ficus carica]
MEQKCYNCHRRNRLRRNRESAAGDPLPFCSKIIIFFPFVVLVLIGTVFDHSHHGDSTISYTTHPLLALERNGSRSRGAAALVLAGRRRIREGCSGGDQKSLRCLLRGERDRLREINFANLALSRSGVVTVVQRGRVRRCEISDRG